MKYYYTSLFSGKKRIHLFVCDFCWDTYWPTEKHKISIGDVLYLNFKITKVSINKWGKCQSCNTNKATGLLTYG